MFHGHGFCRLRSIYVNICAMRKESSNESVFHQVSFDFYATKRKRTAMKFGYVLFEALNPSGSETYNRSEAVMGVKEHTDAVWNEDMRRTSEIFNFLKAEKTAPE